MVAPDPGVGPGVFGLAARSGGKEDRMSDVGGVSVDQLRSFIERIERLEEEKAGLAADIRDIYAEAKGSGFDTKVMRQVVRLRKMEQAERKEQQELLDLYKQAMGMLD